MPNTKFPSFENSFQTLPKLFYEEVTPTPLSQPQLVAVSHSCEKEVGLHLEAETLRAWLNGETRLPGDQRISSRYAGHQFGVWAGQLGDGRAISLGEILTDQGRLEIQTKGSGLTPFSRMGDGKAVIRSSVREFLCSEAMHALGVPTSRAMALLTGSDPVQRETLERSALVARVFPSNLRFGHFEYAYHFGHPQELKLLADYALRYFFLEKKSLEEMLLQIVQSTAELIAQWQSLGFCHGVMNSDNMSILGITLDYGPFGFMENFDPSWICNHSDPQGRYSYQNQPYIGLWNLDRLILCFSKMIPEGLLKEILSQYEPTFWKRFYKEFSDKLGFEKIQPADQELVDQLLGLMAKKSLDFTSTFRQLPQILQGNSQDPEWQDWLVQYRQRLAQEPTPLDLIAIRQDQKNPKYILRNYIAQEIISEVEKGETTKLKDWMKILESPYEEHPQFESYANPTPEHLKNIIVSCSS